MLGGLGDGNGQSCGMLKPVGLVSGTTGAVFLPKIFFRKETSSETIDKTEYLSYCACFEYSKLHGCYLDVNPVLGLFYEFNVISDAREYDEEQPTDGQQDGDERADGDQQASTNEGDYGEAEKSKDDPNGVLLVLREVLVVQCVLSVS